MKDSDYICIGRFTKPFGLEGYVRFESYSGETEHIINIQTITLPSLGKTFDIDEWLTTRPIRCKIKGIDTPEDAQRISGADIMVPRMFAIPLHDDEYYLSDITGMSIVYEGKKCGDIIGVSDAYAPLIEIRWYEQQAHSYIPFIKEFFDAPHFESRTIALLNGDLMNIAEFGEDV